MRVINKAAVFSDTHIGAISFDDRIFEVVEYYRNEGYQIIFLGDVYDFLRNENAFSENKNIFKKSDIYINGNHDFFFRPDFVERHQFSFSFESGGRKFYLTHGDAVDFVFAFKWLSEHKGPWYIKLLSFLGRWKIEHYQRFYMAMEGLPDSIIRAFEHSDVVERLRLAKWAYILIKSMWKPFRPVPLPEHDETVDDYGPLVTFSPKHILRRLFWFDKEAKNHDVVIIGHLHRPTYGVEKFMGSLYEVYVLGAWVHNAPRTFLVIEDGEASLKTLDI